MEKNFQKVLWKLARGMSRKSRDLRDMTPLNVWAIYERMKIFIVKPIVFSWSQVIDLLTK